MVAGGTMQLIMLGCSHLLARPPATATTTTATISNISHHLAIIPASLVNPHTQHWP